MAQAFNSKADHVRWLLLNRGSRTDEDIAREAGTTVGRVYKLKRELRGKFSIPRRVETADVTRGADVYAELSLGRVPVLAGAGGVGLAERSGAPEGLSLVRVELADPPRAGGQESRVPADLSASSSAPAGSVRCDACGLVIPPPVPAACPRCGGA